jgi:dolichol kinase
LAPRRNPNKQITYRAELGRKAIHLSSILIPIGAWFTDWAATMLILVLLLSLSILIDVERHRRTLTGYLIRRYLGFMIRPHEKGAGRGAVVLSGASWMLIAALLSFGFFAKPIAVAAFAMLILCDAVAALIGRRYGSIRFGPRRKSVEGTAAFFVTGCLVAMVVPDLPVLAGMAGALAAAVAEAMPWEVDDNLSVPLSAALVMSLLG